MRISDERKAELFKAISDEITAMRLVYYRDHPDKETLDEDLFRLDVDIWSKIKKVLDIK